LEAAFFPKSASVFDLAMREMMERASSAAGVKQDAKRIQSCAVQWAGRILKVVDMDLF